MNFKVIAISPLKGCSVRYSKVLKRGEIYYLFKDYCIEKIGKLETLDYSDSYPESLFDLEGRNKRLNINISAIVGENGSGKSTIMELLFRAINNIASNYRYEEDNPEKTILAGIQVLKGLKVEFYYQTNKIYKVIVNDEKFSVYSFRKSNPNSKNSYILNSNPINNFSLRDLFYTEVVNYSHYAYNSNYEGDWIQNLFHKNDSYQTPVVFNPMRTNGNSDINTENHLVKQRLISNLVRPKESENFNFRIIGEHLEAYKVKFKLKPPKNKVLLYEKSNTQFGLSKFDTRFRNNIIDRIFRIFYLKSFDENNLSIDNKTFSRVRSYVIYKLISITIKYDEYKKYFLRGKKQFNLEKIDEYIQLLYKDDSHITFKLKQTLNFLYFNHLSISDGQEIEIDDLSKSIATIRSNNKEIPIIELIPPPIFDFDIVLTNKINKNEIISFDTLSSGEKQLIYSVSSILYHLTNLDSVSENKVQYQNINIVLEEIELYFHPNLQRKYISYLLNSINNIRLDNLSSINIQFITHSPFVLSDIPSSNILFLKVYDGKANQEFNKKKTFGANIHDILADNFFFDENIYIGKFAKEKINQVISEINQLREVNSNQESKTLENLKPMISEGRIKYLNQFIVMIDEHVLKLKLAEMLSEALGEDQVYNNIIDNEIEYLQSKKRK